MWIEIFKKIDLGGMPVASQPARAVWIEMLLCWYHGQYWQSQPARAVWIEIKVKVDKLIS